MAKKDIIKKLKYSDRVVRIISNDGKFKAAFIINSNVAQIAQEKHDLPPICAYYLARLMSAASLLASFLEGDERFILVAEGSGPISKVIAEAIQVGEARGYVEYASKIPTQKLKGTGDALGNGIIKIHKILYNRTEPLISEAHFSDGKIAVGLAKYFFESEQLPTAMVLDTEINRDDKIKYSCGFFIQALPGASEEHLDSIFNFLQTNKSLIKFLEAEMKIEDILKKILPFNFKIVISRRVDFYCRCSKEKFMSQLTALKLDESKNMKAEGQNELVCSFCNEKYLLMEKDFDSLIQEIQAKSN